MPHVERGIDYAGVAFEHYRTVYGDIGSAFSAAAEISEIGSADQLRHSLSLRNDQKTPADWNRLAAFQAIQAQHAMNHSGSKVFTLYNQGMIFLDAVKSQGLNAASEFFLAPAAEHTVYSLTDRRHAFGTVVMQHLMQNLQREQIVCEAGCGSEARPKSETFDQLPFIHYHAVDPALIVESEGLTRGYFGRDYRPDFEDGRADAVLANLTVPTYTWTREGLEEFYETAQRLLRKEGRLFIGGMSTILPLSIMKVDMEYSRGDFELTGNPRDVHLDFALKFGLQCVESFGKGDSQGLVFQKS